MADTVEPVDEITQSARNWVDSLAARNQWRLQILSKRYRKDASGNLVEQPIRIRRFAEGCPASGIKQALDYLLSLAPYEGVIFNGQTLDGQYLPTITRWSRDDQDLVNSVRSPRTDGTYTIVQDLIDRRYVDEYEFRSQSSCSSEATSNYVWDAVDIEDIPVGGVGHTYSIQAVSRNEDGTLNYALVHHHALTQHLPETVTENSALRWASVEYWDNVYPGATEGAYVDHNGNTLSIPAPGVSDGVETKVSTININDDCTLRIQVTREKANPADIRRQSRHTIYQGDHEEDSSGALLPLPLAPEAAGGVVTTNESTLQNDGRYANKHSLKIERSVPHASVEVRVGMKGRRITTVNRHQATPAETSGIEVGGTVRVERTDGNLYDNTISVWDRTDPVRSGERCEDNLFSHTDVATTSGIAAIPTDHVSGGTNGIVRTRRTDMDEEGAIIQTVETSQEKNVEDADEEWSVTVDGVVHRRVHRNRTMLNKGTAPAFSITNIGTTVRNERTPGGLVTVTESSLDRNTGSLKTAADCAKTIFEHSDSSSETNPAGTIPVAPVHVNNAGGGHTYKRQSRLNSVGALVTVDEDTQELPVTEAQMTFRRTTRGLITTRVDRNGDTAASDPGSAHVGCTSSHEKTPGGLYNLTTVTVTADATKDSAYCAETMFEHVHDSVEVSTTPITGSEGVVAPGSGKHRVLTKDLDSDGFVKTVIRETTEKPQRNAEVSYRRTLRGLVTTTTDRNVTDTAMAPTESQVGFSQAHRLNPGGTYDLTKVELTKSSKPDSGYCAKTLFEHVHDTVTMSTGDIDIGDVDSAANGHHKVKTQDMDQDGFIKTVVRDTEELEVQDAEVEYESDHFTKTKRITTRNTTANETEKDYVAANANKVVRVSVSKTPGDKRVKVETTTEAQYRHWDQEVSLTHSYSKIYWFQNATTADKTELFNEAKSAFDSKLRGWNSGGREPSNYGCTPKVDLNRFGTFDGSFTFHASWHPESAGQDGLLDYQFWYNTYTKVSVRWDPHYGDGKAYVRKTRTEQDVYFEIGRGVNRYAGLVTGFNMHACDGSIDPITHRFSLQKVTAERIAIEYDEVNEEAADYSDSD